MPVYSHLVEEDLVQQVAMRIRNERRRCGWTLKELAARVPASIATLSAIENAQASTDIGLLFQLAEAFGVPPQQLLFRSKTSHFEITRRTAIEAHPPAPLKVVSRTRRGVTPYHNRLWPLADAFVGKYIEPYEIEIQPVRDEELRFISHTHEEFLFVLDGRLEVLIKAPQRIIRERLGPGDCIYFWSYLPHCIRSTTRQPARSVHVLSSLDGPVDSETADWVAGPAIYMMEASFKNPVEQVADRIVSLRRARGMSAAKFAGSLGISSRRLARIERGAGPIPLKLLLHVCRTLRKPPDYFIASAGVPSVAHTVDRAHELRRRSRRSVTELAVPLCVGPQSTGRMLAGGFQLRQMFPTLVYLDGARERLSRMVRHPGQEFVYVLRGQVILATEHDGNPVSHRLSPGDSCLLDASVAHRYAAAGISPYTSAPAEILVVQWHASTAAFTADSTVRPSRAASPPRSRTRAAGSAQGGRGR